MKDVFVLIKIIMDLCYYEILWTSTVDTYTLRSHIYYDRNILFMARCVAIMRG